MTDGKASVCSALKIENVEMAIYYSIMSTWDFSYTKRLEWEIYAARHQGCIDCGAAPNKPCRNIADIKASRPIRLNKRPHDIRIDWTRLLNGLKQRNYYRPTIEAMIRRRIT